MNSDTDQLDCCITMLQCSELQSLLRCPNSALFVSMSLRLTNWDMVYLDHHNTVLAHRAATSSRLSEQGTVCFFVFETGELGHQNHTAALGKILIEWSHHRNSAAMFARNR